MFQPFQATTGIEFRELRFGTYPAQVFFGCNTATHIQDNEQQLIKRPFTKHQLQYFFDHADHQVVLIAAARAGCRPTGTRMFKLAYSLIACGSTNYGTCKQWTSPAIPTPESSAATVWFRCATARPRRSHNPNDAVCWRSSMDARGHRRLAGLRPAYRRRARPISQ